MWKRKYKHISDKTLAFILLTILFPIFVLVCLVLFLSNKGAPFFVQERPGLGGKIFKLLKFKTMSDLTDSNGQLLPDEMRLTTVGRAIRRTSLDELPQLVNVLKGEMSLIGPRPLLVEYLPLYSHEQARRHEVRPGITGWAQVNGRNAINWEKKFELDVWYVENVSFMLDMRILLLTLKKVMKSEGISQEGQSTAEKFKGNA